MMLFSVLSIPVFLIGLSFAFPGDLYKKRTFWGFFGRGLLVAYPVLYIESFFFKLFDFSFSMSGLILKWIVVLLFWFTAGFGSWYLFSYKNKRYRNGNLILELLLWLSGFFFMYALKDLFYYHSNYGIFEVVISPVIRLALITGFSVFLPLIIHEKQKKKWFYRVLMFVQVLLVVLILVFFEYSMPVISMILLFLTTVYVLTMMFISLKKEYSVLWN